MDPPSDLVAAARDAAASSQDLYGLLGTEPTTSKDDIHRAWRRKGLKYHPDKAGANYDAAKYEAFQLARAILTDDAARAAYDGALSAAQQRARAAALMGEERRRFRDELERAEKQAAAAGPGAGGEPADAERETLREAGRRRVEERERAEREAEERDERRKDERIAELEGRLREKEERARRRAEKRARAGAGEAAEPAAVHAAAAAATELEPGGEWRTVRGGEDLPFEKRPLYAYTLARMKAAGARRREALRANGVATEPFVPQWQDVTDPEVKKFISRVPKFGPPPAAEDVEVRLAA